MEKYVIFIAVVIAGLVIWSVKSSREQKRRLLKRLAQEFGEIPERNYDHDHFQSIPHYFEQHRGNDFYIDDITWNDLDMDRIFMLLNNTQSSAGEEYLYKTLRTPSFSEEELSERERLIRYMDEHEDVRTALQQTFWRMGYTRRISLSDYIGSFLKLESKSKASEYIYILLVLACVGLMFVQVSFGMTALIFVLIVNVNAYFKTKAEIESYFICTAYIARIVEGCVELGNRRDAGLEQYEEKMAEAAKPLVPIIKKARVIGNAVHVSDGLAESIMQYVNMVFHLDIISFYGILDNVKTNTERVEELLELVGRLETGIAIASFRRTLPYYAVPEFVTKGDNYLCATDLYHPLVEHPVANCIEETRSVLLTGSNASGKSTFLKTVAINGILAQTVHTSMAASCKTGFYRVMSSMALKDNLETGESYYMVEIRSLKRIMTEAVRETAAPVMCFVDEVLRGTNTVERVAASSRILQSLARDGAFVFAATHDIELTHLLEKEYANYHFREEVLDNDISFNYILNKGRATTRNAIKLLGIMGYDEDVIRKAEETATHFLETGEWRM
jgi:DNA mismatch repair ATPase MutS